MVSSRRITSGPCAPSADDREIAQTVQSAAYASECMSAVFYIVDRDGPKVTAAFGRPLSAAPAVLERLIIRGRGFDDDGLLIVSDLAQETDAAPSLPGLLADGDWGLRFMAAANVPCGKGRRGVLMVADADPHAGLSAAKAYVLRAHAAQLGALIDLQALRTSQADAAAHGSSRTDLERLRLLESVVVNANDAVLITRAEPIDLPGPVIVYCNAAFTRTTGYAESEVLGQSPRILQSPRTDRTVLNRLRRALTRWEPVEVELLNMRKDGGEFWVELSIVPVANEKGWFTHWVSVQRDVSERKAAEETAMRARIVEAENLVLEAEIKERRRVEARLLYTAFHDDLTKLRNRAFFMDRLSVALQTTKKRPAFSFAVLFLDLDRFKLVNDSLGHRVGDLLLIEVSDRLRRCIRPHDTLARVGGDEFALLLEGGDEPCFAVKVAERLREAMRQPLWIDKQEIFASCSVGIVELTDAYDRPEDVLRDADIAMYHAKNHDIGGHAFFASEMHDDAVEALGLQTDLRNAITRNEFVLHYQPICQVGTAQFVGVEALIRWNHPTRGMVPPGVFIATAEETGAIRDIGRWVLRAACLQMKAWRDQYPEFDLHLSVNTSGEELKDNDFVANLQAILSECGFDPRMLQLEMTEAVFLQHPEQVAGILVDLRSLGVRIALDDFGTGYSSLSYLDTYELDTIKIDRSFIERMHTSKRTRSIVEAIISLAYDLDLDIVAEGVEDEEQHELLRSIGCELVQGFLFGAPLSSEDLSKLLPGNVWMDTPLRPNDQNQVKRSLEIEPITCRAEAEGADRHTTARIDRS